MCYRKRICNETNDEKQSRLECKSQNYKKRKLNSTLNVTETDAQNLYLNDFHNTENGKLHKQSWAKKNI